MTSIRDALLLAALLAGTAQAAPSSSTTGRFVAQAQPADDDEDEGEHTATPAKEKPAAASAATPDSDQPAPKPSTEIKAAPAPANADAKKLVSGAPLFNPNVAVHIVEQKVYSDSRRAEVALYPAAMQVNGKFTQHYGTMGSFIYHLQENFGLQLTGGYNWYNTESSFNRELVNKFSQSASAATSLLWTWGVSGGVEVSPFFGKFALFEGTLAHFSFVLIGGVGAGGTRLLLTPETERKDGSVAPATYGDAGIRFMGSLGAGFRLRLGERFAFRAEVRDVVYTARVERINGCGAADLTAINMAIKDPANAKVSEGCQLDTFTGKDDTSDIKRSVAVPQALRLVNERSSDVLNNIGLYLGISFLF